MLSWAEQVTSKYISSIEQSNNRSSNKVCQNFGVPLSQINISSTNPTYRPTRACCQKRLWWSSRCRSWPWRRKRRDSKRRRVWSLLAAPRLERASTKSREKRPLKRERDRWHRTSQTVDGKWFPMEERSSERPRAVDATGCWSLRRWKMTPMIK